MNAVVCLFAKRPEPGAVKTRIARHLGEPAAVALAWALLRDAIAAARAVPGLKVVIATTGEQPFADPSLEHWDQGVGPLGERIVRVLQRGIAEAGLAFAVGADTFGLSEGALLGALALADTSPAVLGPASDGGFWLLGLREAPDGLLDGLPWSDAQTAARVTERVVERLGACVLAAEGDDVDELADLVRLGDRPCGAHTRAWLDAHLHLVRAASG